ncbi:thioredoxin domain-containing protein 15 [Latimeria chalumnae]|uniref:Thioredoxin domain containing 15 n=1 Tax=Latimeria chalumnae TaxID=7897 RepID=H3AEA2_LATCH|nr:PREDICTED: thioredoxin domain-containing protein 15 [Latimeria chalumnae]|eukprot:XP_005995957.1 PREDICTED: thioredoxin domain-containing protein 15 [Latimeria chalumnae]
MGLPLALSSTSRGFIFTLLIAAIPFHLTQGAEDAKETEAESPEVAAPSSSANQEEESPAERSGTIQFRTAEIADAMLGTGAANDASVVLSLIPKGMKESQALKMPCDADSGGCSAKENLLSLVPSTPNAAGVGGGVSVLSVTAHGDPGGGEDPSSTETAKTPKVSCDARNVSGTEDLVVHVLNVSQDLMEFINANSSECSLVLFYTPWCCFSANLAPHFNALPRAFPTFLFLALDASQHSSLSTRFGTVAVPNILLFQGAKPMARFNHTDRTLGTLKTFLFNQTGIEAKPEVEVTEGDWTGPLPSVPVKGIDWLLVFSLLFVASFATYATVRTESIRWLIPGQEHEHQE